MWREPALKVVLVLVGFALSSWRLPVCGDCNWTIRADARRRLRRTGSLPTACITEPVSEDGIREAAIAPFDRSQGIEQVG
jgi:hypothetical protein